MKNVAKKLLIHAGFIGLLVVSVSLPLPAQRGGRGARGTGGDGGTAQSQGGNSPEEIEKRKAIVSQLKAAIARENLEFKRAMDRIKLDQQGSTSDVERDLIKVHAASLRRDHQAALKKLKADLQAAQSAPKR